MRASFINYDRPRLCRYHSRLRYVRSILHPTVLDTLQVWQSWRIYGYTSEDVRTV